MLALLRVDDRAVTVSQRSPVRSRRCPGNGGPLIRGEPGRLFCVDEMDFEVSAPVGASDITGTGGAARRPPLPVALAGCAAFLVLTMILGVAVGSAPLSPAAVFGVIADHLGFTIRRTPWPTPRSSGRSGCCGSLLAAVVGKWP